MIKGLLHNAFRDQIGINQTMAVADLLAAAVPSLYATADPALVDVGLELQDSPSRFRRRSGSRG